MFQSVVLPVLLVIANVMGAGMIVPQVVRLHRSGGAAGVSVRWAGVSFTMNVAWVLYATTQELWGLVPVSVVGGILYLVIGQQLRRILGRRATAEFVLAAVVSAAWPLAGFVLGGWTGAGLATGLAYGGQFLPAAIAAFRSTDLSGISTWTWGLAFIESTVWVIYAVAERDGPVLAGGGGGALVSGVILARLVHVRRRPLGPDPLRNVVPSPPRRWAGASRTFLRSSSATVSRLGRFLRAFSLS